MTDDKGGSAQVPDEQVRALADEAHEMGSKALQEGRHADAEKVFGGLVEMTPDDASAHASLALALLARGAHNEAERHLRRATELAPTEASHWLNLGKLYLFANSRTRRAVRALAEAVRLAPHDVDALYVTASAHRARGDLAAFESHLREVLQQQPDHVAALNDLGCLLAEGGARLDEAVALLRRAADAGPDDASIAVNLANALYLADDLEAAYAAFSAALEVDPDAVEALRGTAMIDRRRLRLDVAEKHARAYCERTGNAPIAQNLLGTVLREKGDLEPARAEFEGALARNPNFAPAASNLAMLELLLGDWEQGLRRYEARWNDPSYTPRRNYKGLPHWDGSDGAGRRILLFAEQGFGDCLQFGRFARDVKDRGFEVCLEVRKPLYRLFETLDPEISLRPAEGHDSDVDVIAPLMSLPLLLGIDGPGSLSGAAYLSPPSGAGSGDLPVDAGARLRVGLNWCGNPQHMENIKRSVPVAELAPLGDVAGVQFLDLSFDPRGTGETPPFPTVDVADRLEDFADTAALMAELDLVVTVDTATAHLAGALGVPCWVMLAHVPDWRWGIEGETCPWYASARLFRQPAAGDWADVVRRVAMALEEKASGR